MCRVISSWFVRVCHHSCGNIDNGFENNIVVRVEESLSAQIVIQLQSVLAAVMRVLKVDIAGREQKSAGEKIRRTVCEAGPACTHIVEQGLCTEPP